MPRRYVDLPDFASDVGYDLQVRSTQQGTVVRVTGDTVVIDPERMRSLVSEAATPKTKVASLTFDARLLIVRGPISLESAQLTMLAETIRFERGGSITLVPSSEKPDRALRIVADVVQFNGGAKRPIDLSLLNDPKVELRLAVRAFDDADRVRGAWSRFVDSVDQDAPPPGSSVAIGEGAVPTLVATWRDEMVWPLFMAAKVRKHFARAPFDPSNRQVIRGLLQRYAEPLRGWRDGQPFAALASVGTAISTDTDLSGRNAAFTPKKDLAAQAAELRTQIDRPGFDRLVQVLSGTVRTDQGAKEALAANTAQITIVQREGARLDSDINELNGSLQQLAQTGKGIADRIRQRAGFLKTMKEQEYRRLRRAQAVKQWTTVAASAVVIAASMGAATPAVAAGVGAGLTLTGDLIAAGETRERLSPLDLAERGAAAYQSAQAFSDAWAKAMQARDLAFRTYRNEVVLEGPVPQAPRKDERRQLGKAEATGRLVLALAAAGKAAAAINGGAIAAPSSLSLSERENEDEEMKTLLVQRAENQHAMSLAAATLTELVRKAEATTSHRAELQLVDFALRGASPTNDQEHARWSANASLLWSMRVARIADQLATLEKSLFFETGMTVEGVSNVLDYPNELRGKADLGVLDAFGGIGGTTAEAEAEARLELEKNKFLVSVDEFLDAVDERWEQYLNSRTDADVYRKTVTFSANSPSRAERAFVQALNGQIEQQVVGGSDVRMVLPAHLPYSFPQSANPYPERLVRARVVDVVLDVSAAKIGTNALEFLVVHPGYGEMRRGQTCYPADLRTSPTDWRYNNTTYEGLMPSWASQEPGQIKINKASSDAFYTRLPARAPYAAVVNVTSDRWQAVPKIKSIVIGFEVMQ